MKSVTSKKRGLRPSNTSKVKRKGGVKRKKGRRKK
jgi:hypothetical protein